VSDALERARSAVRRLKIFPLPSVVLLPGTGLPLHIFEPRYRELVTDALAGDKLFAMAQVVPGQERTPKPELEPVLCIGTISMHEKLEDGRFELLLSGVVRARVVSELPTSKLYREVEAELLEDPAVADGDDDEESLRFALLELVARLPTEVGERVAQATARAKGGALADVLASAVMDDVIRRYEVLCERDVHVRMQMVAEETMLLVAGMQSRKPEGLLN
jgi:Lon protease-like protein